MKTISLIKATMTNDMNIFKIKSKNKKIPLFIALCLMFIIWTNANMLYEKMAPLNMQHIVLSLFAFVTAIVILVEGIYKSGPLIFDCKDDNLLLSLPIERKTVLLIRILKFYIFELLFTALFIIPLSIANIRWAINLDWTFFLTTIIMILTLPIIPITISCIIGVITTSLTSRFKFKNIAQILITTLFLLLTVYVSYNMENLLKYLAQNATSINDLITKIYYPAGLYAKLSLNFNYMDLLVYIVVNILIFAVTITILSKVYFKINSRIKKVSTTNKNLKKLKITKTSKTKSLIKKELTTFFQTPVFIINAGFGLVLFIIASIMVVFKYNSIISILTDPSSFNLSKELITNNAPILILILITATAFMTSITNSVISLEGRNINVLKALPIKTKTILMAKIYSSLLITTPVLLIGSLLMIIKLKINIIESILLLTLSILMPLVSHFIGIIVNIKYPKLDAQNSTEVVKQSTSSFVSVMIGMILLVLNIMIIIKLAGKINSFLILTFSVIIYILANTILYLFLINKSSKEFNKLSV